MHRSIVSRIRSTRLPNQSVRLYNPVKQRGMKWS